MFRLNFKIAVRNLWKNKGFTVINVGGLAIGLASCMILLLYVAYEFGYDKQSKNYEDTYIVYHHVGSSTGILSARYTPGVLADEIGSKIPGVVKVSHISYVQQKQISYRDRAFTNNGIYADPQFLKIEDYKFIRGNPSQVLKKNNVVILTESFAKRLFGNEDPINKTVRLQNEDLLKVEAVIADIPSNSSLKFDYVMPWGLWLKRDQDLNQVGWSGNFCITLVQLQSGWDYLKANAAVNAVFHNHYKDDFSGYSLHPLSKWHLYSKFENGKSVGGQIEQVRIFFVLAVSILLIACVNFMNLSTARSEKRAKEVGVRKTIGSSRKALIGQFLLESLLLAALGMVSAFFLMEISLPYFNGLLDISLKINYSDWRLWITFLGLTLFTGLIAGSYPAFYLSSFSPLQVLKGNKVAAGSSLSFRQAMVVLQFVFAVCLIICTIVIYQQLFYIKNKPIGFDQKNLVEIDVKKPLLGNKAKLELWRNQLLQSGAVTDVSFFGRSVTEGGGDTDGITWPGKNESQTVVFLARSAGDNFAKTMGAVMQGGRDFSSQYTDTANVLINEAAMKAMGLKNAVGTVVTLWDRPVTIIGVMKDFVMDSPYEQVQPLIVDYDMNFVEVMVARLNTSGSVSAAVVQIKEITKRLNPAFPVTMNFVDDSFEEKFQNERLLGTIANWFGGFAIFITGLGLLGLVLYMAEQRKKEISIRKVLGASNVNILTMLNKDFVRLVIAANVIALPVAYIIINKWLSTFTFRVAVSILPFAVALFISLLIAVITVSIQAFKVAKANPVDALKYE